jgi:hypothetical protein
VDLIVSRQEQRRTITALLDLHRNEE